MGNENRIAVSPSAHKTFKVLAAQAGKPLKEYMDEVAAKLKAKK